MQAAATTRLQLEEGLRRAIPNDELALYFQPQLDVSGRMIGAVALLRWHHPELGDIPPDTFIPVAEKTGLIHFIGGWVFDRACSQLNAWLTVGVPFIGHLSINVCPWQFARPDFVHLVSECITQHQIEPGMLMLELTETALLYDLEGTVRKLETLRALGLQVLLDDFGTGYSSLAYLKDLPLDQIKIDKVFVSELDQSGEHTLVETMVAISRTCDWRSSRRVLKPKRSAAFCWMCCCVSQPPMRSISNPAPTPRSRQRTPVSIRFWVWCSGQSIDPQRNATSLSRPTCPYRWATMTRTRPSTWAKTAGSSVSTAVSSCLS